MSPDYGINNYPEPHGQNDVGLGISMARDPCNLNQHNTANMDAMGSANTMKDGYGAPGPTYYHDDSQAYHGLPVSY